MHWIVLYQRLQKLQRAHMVWSCNEAILENSSISLVLQNGGRCTAGPRRNHLITRLVLINVVAEVQSSHQ